VVACDQALVLVEVSAQLLSRLVPFVRMRTEGTSKNGLKPCGKLIQMPRTSPLLSFSDRRDLTHVLKRTGRKVPQQYTETIKITPFARWLPAQNFWRQVGWSAG